jgi:general secretion pathway protein C
MQLRSALEALLKRRFFIVHLLFSAVVAVLLARTVTSLLSQVVLDKLKKPVTAAAPAKGARSPKQIWRDFEGAAEANIFGGKREQLEEAAAQTDAAHMPDGGACDGAPKASRLRLVGAVVFSDEEFSLASIVDEGKGGPAQLYSLNACESASVDPDDPDSKLAPKPEPCDKVGDGFTLRRIEAERVCVWSDTDGRMEYLALNEPPEKGAAPRSEKKGEDVVASNDDADIRKVGENSYEVGQGEVDKALNNLSDLATQARVVPAFEGGKTIGFKLFSIRPGSLYSKIGLQNGDVITRINGYEINSPEKGLEIYGKLKDSKAVTVDMKRRGKPMTLDYNIK